MEVSATLLENGDSLQQHSKHAAQHPASGSDPQAPSTPSETGGDSSAEPEEEEQEQAVQQQQEQHEEGPGSEEAQDTPTTGVGHAVREVSLVCPQPDVEKLDSTYASLVWATPRFAPGSGEGPAELQIHRFEVDWAQVAEPGQPIQENDWRPLPSGDVDTPDVKVAGLRPGYTYAVRVRPVLDCDDIDQDTWEVHTLPSPPAVFTTLASVPSQAKPPLLVSKGRKAIKVKWAYPEEPGGPDMCISYSLFVSPPPTDHFGEADPEGFVMVYSGEDTSFKLQKLVPGQRYTFWVLYWNQLGCSERGLPATFSTQATVPAQPTPPVPVKSTESSISFHWKAPPNNGSDITSYHLERDEGTGQGSNFVLAYAGPLLCAQVKGLRSGTQYRFRLRATNGEGPSYWSECISASTAASLPSCPTSPVVTHVAKESATMTWGLPEYDGGAPVGFHEVQLQALSRAATDLMGPDWLQTFEGTTQGCTFMQLRPGCAYRARIRSANSSGWGPFCFPVEFATSPEVPDAPGPPAIQEGGATSLVVQWHPPLHNGGARITCYQLHMCPLPGVAYTPSPLVRTLTQQQLQRNTLAASASMAASMGLPPTLQPLHVQAPQLAFSPLPPPPPRHTVRTSAPPQMPAPPMPQSHPLAHRAAAHMAFHSAAPLHSAAPVQMPVPLMPPTLPPRVSSPISPVAPQMSAPLSPPFSPPMAPFYAGNGMLMPQPPLVAPPKVLAAHVEPTTYLVYAGEEPIANVTGLQPGGAYQFRARAINSEGPGKWSEWSVLGTAAGPPPAPSPPLAASRPTSTTLAIKWQAPTSNCGSPITGYVVQVLVVGYVPSEGSEPRLVVRKPTSPNGHNISQELRQRSRAASASPQLLSSADLGSRGGVSSVGGGQSSASVSAYSDETGVENGGEHASPDMLVMGGEDHNLHGAAMAPRWTTVCKCSTPSTELRNLEPSTRYAIRVAALNQVGQSDWSGENQLQTAPAAPAPPGSVQAEAMGPRSIGVAWLPCSLDNGAPVVAYAVDMLHLGVAGSATFARLANAAGAAGPWEHVATLGPADTKTMIVGSLPGRSYRVRVRAVNACGPSQPAYAPSIIATHAAPPGPPGKVVVLQRGAQHARFKWEPCHEENGAAVNQFCLEINGPVSNDFAPCGDGGRAPSKTARSSHTGSMDESVDKMAMSAALDNVEPSSSWRVAYIGSSTQARIPGLMPATHYWCRVHGCNRAGPGPCSQAEAFNTTLLPPGAPQGVEATLERAGDVAELIVAAGHTPSTASLRQSDREVVVVRWEAPEANPLEAQPVGYEVLASPCSGSPQSAGEVRCPAPKGAQECVLERGLMAGISYLVRVRAVGAGGSGHGAWSEACEVIAPSPLEADSASTSELDAAASTGHAPSTDSKASGKKRKNKQAPPSGPQGDESQALAQVPQPKGGSGKAAKNPSSSGGMPIVKPEPSLTTWRGIKLQGSRLWKRVKAFKWHIACFLLIVAVTSAFQMFPVMELLARHKESVMLILLFLILFSFICLIAHIWVTWKQPPPAVKSKQKKT